MWSLHLTIKITKYHCSIKAIHEILGMNILYTKKYQKVTSKIQLSENKYYALKLSTKK